MLKTKGEKGKRKENINSAHATKLCSVIEKKILFPFVLG